MAVSHPVSLLKMLKGNKNKEKKMIQKYLVGDKVKVILEGTITECYIGYNDKLHQDALKYKVVSDYGVGIAIEEEKIEKIT